MRYFIRLSYNGANYHGWQVQPNGASVQGCLEQALAMALHKPVAVTGAGRTDAGVNAAMMVAHFDTDPLDDTGGLTRRLNGILPRDIAVQAIFPVHDTAHARFDATSRTYKYFVATGKMPFHAQFSWMCCRELDFALMNQAAALLPSHTDFTSFSKLHTDTVTNNCRVSHAHWDRGQDGLWVFTITADRFLRNMVRAIVGTLVEVGRHKLTPDGFNQVIEARDRCRAGTSMPGNALFLWNITYPYPIK